MSPSKNAANVEIRGLVPAEKVAFGFIYLPDETRVGFSSATDDEGQDFLELWVGNWGEPTRANLKKAMQAGWDLAGKLGWDPKVRWKA